MKSRFKIGDTVYLLTAGGSFVRQTTVQSVLVDWRGKCPAYDYPGNKAKLIWESDVYVTFAEAVANAKPDELVRMPFALRCNNVGE